MAKWAFWTVLLYIIVVMIVFVPAIWWVVDLLGGKSHEFSIFLDSCRVWQFWLFCGIIVAVQALLLLFPVKQAQQAPVPKRAVWVPLVTTALLFSILLLGVIWSILMAIGGDDILTNYFLWVSLVFVLLCWGLWTWAFYRFTHMIEPAKLFVRAMTWLIRGSILELLIAVPSHIIVRRRDDCCAPGFTFIGITAGVVIMALAFGPGVFFLFQRRFDQMKPRAKRTSHTASTQ